MDLKLQQEQIKTITSIQISNQHNQFKNQPRNIIELLQTPSKIPKLKSKDTQCEKEFLRPRCHSHYQNSQNNVFPTKIPRLSMKISYKDQNLIHKMKQVDQDGFEQIKTPIQDDIFENHPEKNMSTLDSSTQSKFKTSMLKKLNNSASQTCAMISDSSNSSDQDDFLMHSGQFNKTVHSNYQKLGSKKIFFRRQNKAAASLASFSSDEEQFKASHSNDQNTMAPVQVKRKIPSKKKASKLMNQTFAFGFTQPIKEQLTVGQKIILNQKQKNYIKQLNSHKPHNSLCKINILIFTHIFMYLQSHQILKVGKVCRNIRSCLMRKALWKLIYLRYPKEQLILSDHHVPKFKFKPQIFTQSNKTQKLPILDFKQSEQYDPIKVNEKALNPSQYPLILNQKAFFSGKNIGCSEFNQAQEFKQNYILERSIPSNLQKCKYQLFKLIGHKSDIRAIDAQGHEIVTGSKDSHVMYWNIDRKRTFVMPEHSNQIEGVQLLSKCKRIVTSAGDRQVIITSYEDEKNPEVIVKRSHKYKVNGIRKFRDNSALSYGDDNSIRVWNAQSGEIRQTIDNAHPVNKRVNIVATQKLNSSFCVSTDHAQVKLWDIQRGICTFCIGDQDNWKPESAKTAKHPYQIHSVALSTDNLLFTGERKVIRLWDLRQVVKKTKAAAYEQKLGEQWFEQFKQQKNQALMPNIEDFKCDYQSDVKTKFYNFTIGTYPSRIKYIENYQMIVAMASTNNRIITYDIRRGQKLEWYETHSYPITSFDTGKTLMTSHIAAVAGRNKGYHFCLKFINLLKKEETQPWDKVINPAQNAAIMKVFFGDEVVVTGSRDGGVTAMDLKMGREYLSKRPVILKNVPPS